MQVRAANRGDTDSVMQLLSDARRWHIDQEVDVWSEFDRALIERDVLAGRVYLAMDGASACGTVTLVEADPLVWGPDEKGDALYIHKLASSRAPCGRGIGAGLIQWARTVARQRRRKWLRLDTWNTNRKMREYYEKQGFRHVRDEFFPLVSPLPADYRGTYKSLYQLAV